MMRFQKYILAWWKLSRVPFLSVGLLPLILGFVLAWRSGYKGAPGLYLLSSFVALLIMWMTYYLGEWNDLEGDRINQNFNRFSGGSRVLVDGTFPAWVPFSWDMRCLAAAVVRRTPYLFSLSDRGLDPCPGRDGYFVRVHLFT